MFYFPGNPASGRRRDARGRRPSGGRSTTMSLAGLAAAAGALDDAIPIQGYGVLGIVR